MSAFAVFGNPVKHSKSPEIYKLFANEIHISNKYDLRLVSKRNFDSILLDFFNSGGLGANITVPFKERALVLCHRLTERAMIANSVNTIKKENNNILLGDNTDGIGLINDLKRLRWIDQNNIFNNHNKSDVTNILIIGTGGAAKGILSVLLKMNKCYINVVNRTLLNAKKLMYYYHSIGYQNISYIDSKKLCINYNKKIYNLIINATSSSMHGMIPAISSSVITQHTRCYDLFYQKQDTVFIRWCKYNGAHCCSDGLGMLVEQAAYSFNLWHNFYPSTVSVFNHLQSTFRV